MSEPRDKRIPIMMSEGETKAIDDWRFSNRIDTRSEAVRRLCQIALHIGDTLNDIDRLVRAADSFHEGSKRAALDAFKRKTIVDKPSKEVDAIALYASDMGEMYGSITMGAAIALIRDLQDKRDKLIKVQGVEEAMRAAYEKEPDVALIQKDFDEFMGEWNERTNGAPFVSKYPHPKA